MSESKNLKKWLGGTLVGAITIVAAVATAGVPDAPKTWEKCAGVSKKGMNDCGSTDGKHSCSGKALRDNDDTEWVYMPKGTCTKLSGGFVVGAKPAKSKK